MLKVCRQLCDPDVALALATGVELTRHFRSRVLCLYRRISESARAVCTAFKSESGEHKASAVTLSSTFRRRWS